MEFCATTSEIGVVQKQFFSRNGKKSSDLPGKFMFVNCHPNEVEVVRQFQKGNLLETEKLAYIR